MREDFEKAILDNPGELFGYAVYGDWLQEQGDPRGEFIQVQLALEDESQPKSARRAWQARERELLDQHEREWLGELAEHLLDRNNQSASGLRYRWQRGFLASLELRSLTRPLAQSLATASSARFLRELRIDEDEGAWDRNKSKLPPPRVPTPAGLRRHLEMFELIGSPCLSNLQIFQIGNEDVAEGSYQQYSISCHVYAPGLEHVIASMPRIEELHLLCKEYDVESLFALSTLTHLRVLRLYHVGVRRADGREREQYEYPLDVLAANPALTNLTQLLFHPHHEEYHQDHHGQPHLPSFLPLDQVRALVHSPHLKRLTHLQLRLSNMGDQGCRLLVESGILRQLRWLDLRHGCITDEGAGSLAACPDLRHLEYLNLQRNGLTKAGADVLRATGVQVQVDDQLTAQELAEEHYLFEGDSE